MHFNIESTIFVWSNYEEKKTDLRIALGKLVLAVQKEFFGDCLGTDKQEACEYAFRRSGQLNSLSNLSEQRVLEELGGKTITEFIGGKEWLIQYPNIRTKVIMAETVLSAYLPTN